MKKRATFKWKDAISGFPVSPDSAEVLVRWGGKIRYILIVCFLGNSCAKNYRNWTVYVKILASCDGGTFFETRCIRQIWGGDTTDSLTWDGTRITVRQINSVGDCRNNGWSKCTFFEKPDRDGIWMGLLDRTTVFNLALMPTLFSRNTVNVCSQWIGRISRI